MEPWVFTDKNKMSSFRSGTNSASIGALAFGVYRPYGAQKCVETINPGLAPWAMQEDRPYRALCIIPNQLFSIIMCSSCLFRKGKRIRIKANYECL